VGAERVGMSLRKNDGRSGSTGPFLKAWFNEAVQWSAAEFSLFFNAPTPTFLYNLVQFLSVLSVSLYNSFKGPSQKAGVSETYRHLAEIFNPNMVNALFWGINFATAGLSLLGVIVSCIPMEELRMKTFFAFSTLCFYLSVGLGTIPAYKRWLSTQSKSIQGLCRPDLFVAPAIPICFNFLLTSMGKEMGYIELGSMRVPLLEICTYGLAIGCAVNSFRQVYAPARSFILRNPGIVICTALNMVVLLQAGIQFIEGIRATLPVYLGFSQLFYMTGGIIYCYKESRRHRGLSV